MLLRIQKLTYTYPGSSTRVLDLSSLELSKGESVFLRGASGSGKSTLLALIAGVLKANTGQLELLGKDLLRLSGGGRDALRAEHLGIVFQQFNLLPFLSVQENVLLAAKFSKARAEKAAQQHGSTAKAAQALLDALGLLRLNSARVDQLSVGQQQRVAVARALLGGPDLVICDEPTSALDADTRDDFIRLLLAEAAHYKSSILFVSHDASLASKFDRSIDLSAINRVDLAQKGETHAGVTS